MTRTIAQYMATLTAEDAAIYARVVERASGYLPMIAADTRDAEIMRPTEPSKTSHWRDECSYISSQTDNARRGKLDAAFNYDRACLIRYATMQRNSATRDGFHDAAQYIQHCIDDLETQS